LNVQVFPPFVSVGIFSAMSGTTTNDLAPDAFVKASKPSYVAMYRFQYCSV
jgi:hypothetical protein